MSGGELLALTVVQLVLTAAPGAAATLLAARFGVRDVPVLLAIGLAAGGVVAMATFWAYYLGHGAGNFCAYAVLIGSIALIAWCGPPVRRHGGLLRGLAVPLGLWALGVVFIVFFGFLHGGTEPALETASFRFATDPSQFASDSYIPLVFSDWMFAGHPGPPPIFEPDWHFSDRPPLQTAYVLTERVFGWDTTTLHYQLLGVAIQQLWIVGMWALLTAAQVSARTRALAMVSALVGDVAIVHSFYVWPKLLGAAFVLGALALVVAPRESTLRTRPWTIVVFGALAGLALLSHGTGAFGLIPVVAIAIWRGLPDRRRLAAGTAALLVLVVPWMAYQNFEDPPGDRLLKWSLAGVTEVDDRGALETILDSYGEAGLWGSLENKFDNFSHMAGADPAIGEPDEGAFPFGDVVAETDDALSALGDGRAGDAISKVREIRYWHLLWAVGLLMLAAPLIAYGRLRGRGDGEDWRFARICLVFFAVGAACWGLLLFGNPPGRTFVAAGSLALPLVGTVGLVAGLRATYPRWAAGLVAANVATVLILYLPTLPSRPNGGSYSLFAAVTAAAALAGFIALAFRLACPGSWTRSPP